ncbi:nucleosidase [uncultured Pseudokineococcus sp.]|uniref:nucleosidase n=1 Tax=uncultured Pseudokineococcus sp. TaxID=1642928 RepID=UPI002607AE47|nr:nucleosidase [uncultured Pseudokineococcus sp.]
MSQAPSPSPSSPSAPRLRAARGPGARDDVLVVAALAVEAVSVPAHLPLLLTGPGKTAAATAVAAVLAARAPDRRPLVVGVGTAGALREGVGGLHVPGRVLHHDISAAALAQVGAPTRTELELDGLPGAPAGDVVLAAGDVFVSDAVVRDRLAQRAHLVDMEGFAVAWASRSLGARVVLAKHVSDGADDSAWDWADAVGASAQALGEWLAEHLPPG